LVVVADLVAFAVGLVVVWGGFADLSSGPGFAPAGRWFDRGCVLAAHLSDCESAVSSADVSVALFWVRQSAWQLLGPRHTHLHQGFAGTGLIPGRSTGIGIIAMNRRIDGRLDRRDPNCGPKGAKGWENNWIKSVPRYAWFPYFRFYGQSESFFDQNWKLPQIEETDFAKFAK
jgi:hypothetical protein